MIEQREANLFPPLQSKPWSGMLCGIEKPMWIASVGNITVVKEKYMGDVEEAPTAPAERPRLKLAPRGSSGGAPVTAPSSGKVRGSPFAMGSIAAVSPTA
jgi:hypothetical protein